MSDVIERALMISALQAVIEWYEDNIYDGPPGPQDDEGGSGEPECITNARYTLDSIGPRGKPHRSDRPMDPWQRKANIQNNRRSRS